MTQFEKALEKLSLLEAYNARPPYQRNDYLGWIGRAKLETTKLKQLNQMLQELQRGGVYMKMRWSQGIKAGKGART